MKFPTNEFYCCCPSCCCLVDFDRKSVIIDICLQLNYFVGKFPLIIDLLRDKRHIQHTIRRAKQWQSAAVLLAASNSFGGSQGRQNRQQNPFHSRIFHRTFQLTFQHFCIWLSSDWETPHLIEIGNPIANKIEKNRKNRKMENIKHRPDQTRPD